MAGARGRSLLFSPAVALLSGGLAWLWLLGLCYTWADIAGQAGSPRPDNWDTLERILDLVQAGLLPALLLVVSTPVAWLAARKFWPLAWLHPAVLGILCTSLVLDYLAIRADKPYIVAEAPHGPYQLHGSSPLQKNGTSPPTLCWPRGESALPTDVGALSLKAGDLAIIQSIPEVYASIAENPAQAARIRAWVGKTVMITGQSPEGGLWFTPVGTAAAPGDPRFCLRSGDLVKVRTHL